LELLIVILVMLGIVFSFKKKKYIEQKEFQKCESPIEEKLFKALRKEGYKPYSQTPCGKFRIDIALYIKGKKIAIECDGEKFHSSPKQLEHDERKNVYLEKHNWHVFRFEGKEIYHDVNWCVKVIKERVK
jgi:very-short-patch-repair endonuclease